MPAKIITLSEDCLVRMVPDAASAQNLSKLLLHTDVFEEVVPGLDSVAVKFNPRQITRAAAQKFLAQTTIPQATLRSNTKIYPINTQYGGKYGPDLKLICAQLKMSTDEFITAHTAQVRPLLMMGFTPGFCYIEGLSINLPRRETPRAFVPSGSVGIAGNYTGLYALSGPGGWAIIGRTEHKLFAPEDENPFPVAPGDLIQFRAV